MFEADLGAIGEVFDFICGLWPSFSVGMDDAPDIVWMARRT